MENGTTEGKIMREWIEQMNQLDEQVQASQQSNQRSMKRKTPEERLFDEFVSSIVREFLMFIREKQRVRKTQQQPQQIPPRPPGFNPQPNLF